MNNPPPAPLWCVVVGDTEPWRRGRTFLVIYVLLTVLAQAALMVAFVLRGNLDALVINAAGVTVFWLQFYFIWFGVNWVHWLQAGLSAFYGFALIIWGWRDNFGLTVGIGIYTFVFGAYLGLAPSVHFFAQRQREMRRWKEALVVAAVFFILLASLAAGIGGLYGYKIERMSDARNFGNVAFRQIFTDHDSEFLARHATARLMETGGGMAGLSRFLQDATMRDGDVREIKPSVGAIQSWCKFPIGIGTYGEVWTEGLGDRGRMEMHMRIGEAGQEWEIDAVWWKYPDSARR